MIKLSEITHKKVFAYTDALHSLGHAITVSKKRSDEDIFEFLQDSVIQRFEYTIELRWKTLKHVLEHVELIEGGIKSPRESIELAYQYEYIIDLEQTMQMLKDRNVLSHTYSESNASRLYDRILGHYDILTADYQVFSTKLGVTSNSND